MSEETIADILAEMFDFSDKRIEEGRDHAMTSESVGLIVHQLAKRFEAAWKRESAGNAAATREALCEIVLLILKVGRTIRADVACGIIASKAKHALSAPARNCDKMPDIDNLTMHDLAKSPCKSTLEYASREELLELVRWLLAPAAEEGGAK